ncbi:hypothetical protein H8356DRAFT_1344324 [Neocallimastix lanati (nom. inval.)]|nr:hypothetical protein H8356DRAFT_1344324 [Neocallimastix sp. JGI-2020a]
MSDSNSETFWKIRVLNHLSSYDSISDFEDYINPLNEQHFERGEQSSSESPVPKIMGLAEFLSRAIPIISSLSVDVVLIRHNVTTGSSYISTKGESRLSSSINDESGESLVDNTTLFYFKDITSKIRVLNHLSSYDSISDFEDYINHYIYLFLLGSSESPVPKIMGLVEFLTRAIPIISSLSVDVVLIRYNVITGSSSISTKGESPLSSSINNESGKHLYLPFDNGINCSTAELTPLSRNEASAAGPPDFKSDSLTTRTN